MSELSLGQTTDGRVVPLKVSSDGTLAAPVRGSGSTAWQGNVTITNSTANQQLQAGVAGNRLALTDLVISNSHSTSLLVTVKSGTTPISAPILVPLGASVILDLVSALWTAAGQALNVSVDQAVAGSVYATATGYLTP